MHILKTYRREFNTYLKTKIEVQKPENLYEPMCYILDIGGKRVRPVLTMITTEIFGGIYKEALAAALALELFHNFSLMHDDIMDNAPTRRGEITVHEKWDVNTAILSGDAMLIKSYELLEQYEETIFKELVSLLSRSAIEVCEGQQYDVDFENSEKVTLSDYLKMITKKTSVLIAASMEMGAIVAGGTKISRRKMYSFGKNLGIAFQLQDDYLDAYGDPETFGKQLGGDIISNKKTFLYLQALKIAAPSSVRELQHLFSIRPTDPTTKIITVKRIYDECGVPELTQKEIATYTQNAFKQLEKLNITDDKMQTLRQLGEYLMGRQV